MNHYKYILFDLDGTLTDSKEGICKSVQYALKKQGIDEPNIDNLKPFIGPPLQESFMSFYNMSQDEATMAVNDYRERFGTLGLYENRVYDGICPLLKKLKESGFLLVIASSKPTVYIDKILKHFQLDEYFDIVVGSSLDGTLSQKKDVINEALNRIADYLNSNNNTTNNSDKDNNNDNDDSNNNDNNNNDDITVENIKPAALMIGDRMHDTYGAYAAGIDSVGVLYGYGSKKEFKYSYTKYIVNSVKMLEKFLFSEDKQLIKYYCHCVHESNTVTPDDYMEAMLYKKHNNASDASDTNSNNTAKQSAVKDSSTQNSTTVTTHKPSFFKALDAIMPLVIYYVVTYCVLNLVLILSKNVSVSYKAMELESKTIPASLLIITNFSTCIVLYLLFRKRDFMMKKSSKVLPFSFISGATFAISINLIFSYICNLIHQTKALESASYTNVSFTLGIILFGISSPLMEEIIFRWLIYGRVKLMFGRNLSVIITSLFFGFFHGNLVQGTYAFIMSFLLIYVYEKTQNFAAPVLFHIAANISIFCASYLPLGLQRMLSSIVSLIVMAIISIISILTIKRKSEEK